MGTVIVDNDYIEYCSTAGQPGLTIIMACTLVVLEIKEFAQAYAVTHGQLLNCLNSLQGPTNVQCIPSKLGLNQIPCSMQVLVCARGYNTRPLSLVNLSVSWDSSRSPVMRSSL